MRALGEITGYQPFFVAQTGAALHALYSMVPFELLSVFTLKFRRAIASTTPSDGMHILRSSAGLWIFVTAFVFFFWLIANLPGTTGFVLSVLLASATAGLFTFFVRD